MVKFRKGLNNLTPFNSVPRLAGSIFSSKRSILKSINSDASWTSSHVLTNELVLPISTFCITSIHFPTVYSSVLNLLILCRNLWTPAASITRGTSMSATADLRASFFVFIYHLQTSSPCKQNSYWDSTIVIYISPIAALAYYGRELIPLIVSKWMVHSLNVCMSVAALLYLVLKVDVLFKWQLGEMVYLTKSRNRVHV